MLRLGIVGLPNVGKSTLFNALTSAGALVANYPFATIEPNTGVVTVPDPRLDVLTRIVQPERTTPAAVEFLDIAGLVKAPARAKGWGISSWRTSGRSMRSSTSSAASMTTTCST